MEKKQEKVSTKSKIVNKLLIFTGYKRRYRNEVNVKNYINKTSNKKYNTPEKMGLFKENVKYIDLFSYNGNLNDSNDLIILYIHGGSYIENAIPLQINFVKKLAKKLNATLMVPMYKTAPKGNYMAFEKSMDELYADLLKLKKRIVVVGDSAGAGVSLSYTMKLRNEKKNLPTNIILFSPWVDITLSNENIVKQSKYDNICSIDGNLYCGKLWADGIDLNDYRVSPINGDFHDLPRVTLVTGSYDICKPDCLILKEKLKEVKNDYDYIEYKCQGHNFQIYPTKEANEVLNDIIDIIREV